MKNTRFLYLYRDADNYKQPNDCIIQGIPTPEQKQRILNSLDMGEYFIPEEVGLPCTRFGSVTEADHPYCEMSADSFEETDESPVLNLTWEQLTAAFEAHAGKWEPEQVVLQDVKIQSAYELDTVVCTACFDQFMEKLLPDAGTGYNAKQMPKDILLHAVASVFLAAGIPVHEIQNFSGIRLISDESHTEYPVPIAQDSILYMDTDIPGNAAPYVKNLIAASFKAVGFEGTCTGMHPLLEAK